MDRSKAKGLLEDLTFGLRGAQMDTMLAMDKKCYLEAQSAYVGARAQLAGAKAALAALEVCSDKEMNAICGHALKRERTLKGLFTEWFSSSRTRIAWRSFFFPLIHAFPLLLCLWAGYYLGILLYRLMN